MGEKAVNTPQRCSCWPSTMPQYTRGVVLSESLSESACRKGTSKSWIVSSTKRAVVSQRSVCQEVGVCTFFSAKLHIMNRTETKAKLNMWAGLGIINICTLKLGLCDNRLVTKHCDVVGSTTNSFGGNDELLPYTHKKRRPVGAAFFWFFTTVPRLAAQRPSGRCPTTFLATATPGCRRVESVVVVLLRSRSRFSALRRGWR